MKNPFSKTQPEDLSLESLAVAINNLTQQRKALSEEMRDLQTIYASKKAVSKLEAELLTMTDAQKKALVREIEKTKSNTEPDD